VSVCQTVPRSLSPARRPGLRGVLVALAAGVLLAGPAFAQKVRLATSMGDIVVELEPEKAPKTVANFVTYVKAGQYNGTIFHRVIPGFMIQGGGFTPDLKQKATRSPIPLEDQAGLSNVRGTISMARTGDPNSATSQFFINVNDNPGLDHGGAMGTNGYAVFGHVVEGMDVVDKIKNVETGARNGMGDVPKQPVLIKTATLEK
jgi:peptidyl-prolyl cis-trans isomerase A (cyclophilin A)